MTEITERDMADFNEPFELFGSWFEKAKESELNDPNAMNLATATPEATRAANSRTIRMLL